MKGQTMRGRPGRAAFPVLVTGFALMAMSAGVAVAGPGGGRAQDPAPITAPVSTAGVHGGDAHGWGAVRRVPPTTSSTESVR